MKRRLKFLLWLSEIETQWLFMFHIFFWIPLVIGCDKFFFHEINYPHVMVVQVFPYWFEFYKQRLHKKVLPRYLGLQRLEQYMNLPR